MSRYKDTADAGTDYTQRISENNKLILSLDYPYIDSYTTSPRIDLSGDNRDTIAAHTIFDISLAFVHEDDTFKSLRIAAFARDLFRGDNRLTNMLDAGVFYFGAVSPNRGLELEASLKF